MCCPWPPGDNLGRFQARRPLRIHREAGHPPEVRQLRVLPVARHQEGRRDFAPSARRTESPEDRQGERLRGEVPESRREEYRRAYQERPPPEGRGRAEVLTRDLRFGEDLSGGIIQHLQG